MAEPKSPAPDHDRGIQSDNLSALALRNPELAAKLRILAGRVSPTPASRSSSQNPLPQHFARIPRLVIFYGFGNGRSLLYFWAKKPETTREILIIEHDPESFLCQLARDDYRAILGNEGTTLLLGLPIDSFVPSLITYLFANKRFLYCESFVGIVDQVSVEGNGAYYLAASQAFKSAVREIDNTLGTAPADSFLGFRNTLENIDLLFANIDLKQTCRSLSGRTGIVVSSGPSLARHFELLRTIDNAVIVCADSALDSLADRRIEPHLITVVERDEGQSRVFGKLKHQPEGILVGTSLVHPATYAAFPGSKAIVLADNPISRWLPIEAPILATGPSCGNFSFTLLVNLGCNPIILLGQDLAFERGSRATHFGSCISKDIIGGYETLQNDGFTKFQSVEGNDGTAIETTNYWIHFKAHLEIQISNYSGKAYNVIPKEYGAKLQGAIQIDSLGDPCLGEFFSGRPIERPTPIYKQAAQGQKERHRLKAKMESSRSNFEKLLLSLDRIIGSPLLSRAGEDLTTSIRLDSSIDRLKNLPAYNDLLLPIASPYLYREAIHRNAIDPHFSGNEAYLRLRSEQQKEWLEVVRIWSERILSVLSPN